MAKFVADNVWEQGFNNKDCALDFMNQVVKDDPDASVMSYMDKDQEPPFRIRVTRVTEAGAKAFKEHWDKMVPEVAPVPKRDPEVIKRQQGSNIQLRWAERMILSRLLRAAGEEFSNHGCNDFDASELSPAQRQTIHEEVKAWSKDPGYEADDSAFFYDWMLMSYFADLIDPDTS
jgi:hypothetical protein